MRYLSLFSGIGGGDLAMQHLLGFNCLGYVEKDEFCQKLLREKIEYEIFNEAPIFSDIKSFISEGYAKEYKGMVDLITAGFPCQPFSTGASNRRKGEKDERNLWPDTLSCIWEIQPRFAFLENVPGLLSIGYFGSVVGQMAEIGYDCKWVCLSACRLGSKLLRRRLFILGYSKRYDVEGFSSWNPGNKKLKRYDWYGKQDYIQNAETSWLISNGFGSRNVDDAPFVLDRIKGIGNAQVPIQAATAFRILEGVV